MSVHLDLAIEYLIQHRPLPSTTYPLYCPSFYSPLLFRAVSDLVSTLTTVLLLIVAIITATSHSPPGPCLLVLKAQFQNSRSLGDIVLEPCDHLVVWTSTANVQLTTTTHTREETGTGSNLVCCGKGLTLEQALLSRYERDPFQKVPSICPKSTTYSQSSMTSAGKTN